MTLYRRILVPLDGSPVDDVVLAHVVRLAETFHSEVVLLRVAHFHTRDTMTHEVEDARAVLDRVAPTVAAVAVVDGFDVDVTFSEAMGPGATTALNYTLSGSGQGSLAANPASVALMPGFNCSHAATSRSSEKDASMCLTERRSISSRL